VRHRSELLVSDWLVPEADPDVAAQAVVADAAAGNKAIAFVGHEPHLGELFARLLFGRGAIPLKKGMLVGVELDSAAAARGRLVCCLSAKLAGRLAGD
jgi:phosphohistidine phosphatase SixA